MSRCSIKSLAALHGIRIQQHHGCLLADRVFKRQTISVVLNAVLASSKLLDMQNKVAEDGNEVRDRK
jgi:hypothetical protein